MVFFTCACAPRFFPAGERLAAPEIEDNIFVAADNTRLPLRVWRAEAGSEKAVVIALHGFNDYSRAFDLPATWWANSGLTVYAWDQRGFGASPNAGYWHDASALADDLHEARLAISRRHPGIPIYFLGSSMGGAVILTALGRDGTQSTENIAGVILLGPAVWGVSSMNPALRFGLWLAAHTMPANHLTGEGLNIKPSDNIPMLRALGRDPLVIKSTRVDALYGLVGLMSNALEAASKLDSPALVLGAADDQLVPGHAHDLLLKSLKTPHTEVIYPDGFHMLLRDLQAKVVWKDILAWILAPDAPLPSGLGRKIVPPAATVR